MGLCDLLRCNFIINSSLYLQDRKRGGGTFYTLNILSWESVDITCKYHVDIICKLLSFKINKCFLIVNDSELGSIQVTMVDFAGGGMGWGGGVTLLITMASTVLGNDFQFANYNFTTIPGLMVTF